MSEDQAVGTALYAKCVTCDLELATPARAEAHQSETFEESLRTEGWDRGGAGAVGHTTRTISPTADERRRARIQYTIRDALEDAFCRIDRDVDDGHVTFEEIDRALAAYDVQEEYRAWRQDDDEELEAEGGQVIVVHPDQGQLL